MKQPEPFPRLRQPDTRWWCLPELYYLQEQAFLALGQIDPARRALVEAHPAAEAMGERNRGR